MIATSCSFISGRCCCPILELHVHTGTPEPALAMTKKKRMLTYKGQVKLKVTTYGVPIWDLPRAQLFLCGTLVAFAPIQLAGDFMAKNSNCNAQRGLKRTIRRHRKDSPQSLKSPDGLRALGELIAQVVISLSLLSVTCFILSSKHPLVKTILCVLATLALTRSWPSARYSGSDPRARKKEGLSRLST